MSLYEVINRNATPGSKTSFDYLLVYSACFALYLMPVAARRLHALTSGKARNPASIFGETSALAANCAASSFAGL